MTQVLPRGVSFDKSRNKYKARIGRGGRTISLGSFDTVQDARDAYLADVAENGEPKPGALSPEQQRRQQEAYALWLANRITFADAILDQLGLFDTHKPWPLSSEVAFEGRRYRLSRFDDDVTKYGEIVTVAMFSSPCISERCSNSAWTYLWLHKEYLKSPARKCDACDPRRKAAFEENRVRSSVVWAAVHEALRSDQNDGVIPEWQRSSADALAARMREHLKTLMEVVYSSLDELSYDWWHEAVARVMDNPSYGIEDGGMDVEGNPIYRPRMPSERLGRHERHVLEIAEAEFGSVESVALADLVSACAAALPEPIQGKRDDRRFQINRAVQSLARRKEAPLAVIGGKVLFYA